MTNIKLNKPKYLKWFNWVDFFMVSYGNIIKKSITDPAVSFVRDIVLEIVSNLVSNAIFNVIDNKNKWKRSSKKTKRIDFIYFK